jgi:hypothetical protein
MNAADETRRLLKQRDKMLRDAFHGRNGLSMTEKQKAEHRAMMERARLARVQSHKEN